MLHVTEYFAKSLKETLSSRACVSLCYYSSTYLSLPVGLVPEINLI